MHERASIAPHAIGANRSGKDDLLWKMNPNMMHMMTREIPIVNATSFLSCLELYALLTGRP
jgi:hypothetical protein